MQKLGSGGTTRQRRSARHSFAKFTTRYGHSSLREWALHDERYNPLHDPLLKLLGRGEMGPDRTVNSLANVPSGTKVSSYTPSATASWAEEEVLAYLLEHKNHHPLL
jgi:hypothetical protein